jgi:hypothetical protein
MTDVLVNSHAIPFDDPNILLNLNHNRLPINGLEDGPPSSPDTPVSTPDVKIDLDFQQESNARHEPLPIKHIDKLDRLDAASTIVHVASSPDPGPLFIYPQFIPPHSFYFRSYLDYPSHTHTDSPS